MKSHHSFGAIQGERVDSFRTYCGSSRPSRSFFWASRRFSQARCGSARTSHRFSRARCNLCLYSISLAFLFWVKTNRPVCRTPAALREEKTE